MYELSRDFLEQRQKSEKSDRESLRASIQLLAEISGALTFAGLGREGDIIEKCRNWLENASKSGSVREDQAFTCFAEAFAQVSCVCCTNFPPMPTWQSGGRNFPIPAHYLANATTSL